MPEVIVRKGEPVDRALKRLKNKLDAEGILEEVRRLVNEFQKELLIVGSDLKKAQDQIAALQRQVEGVKRASGAG